MILFLGGIVKAIGGVVNTVGGLVSGAVGGKPGGGGGLGGLLGGVFDTFSKIGGGGFLGMVGGMLGGPIGAVAGNLLGSIVGGGKLPLPSGFGGLLTQLPSLVQKGMEALGSLGKGGGMLEGLNQALKLVSDLLGKLGGAQQQKPGIPGLVGQLLPAIQDIIKPPASGQPGGVAPGGVAPGGGKTGDSLVNTGLKAYDQLNGLEKQLENLDPESKTYEQDMLKLKNKMQKIQQMISLVNEMLSMKHQMSMQTISKISG
jgi:hypothetical protein